MCHICVPDQQLYLFPLAQWLETLCVEVLLKCSIFFSLFELSQLMVPSVISSDVQAAIRVHGQNELCGPNISDKLSVDGMCIKARNQQNYPGNNVE